METRVAVLAIIVENMESVEELNKTLHEYGNFIIGRMGLPYKKRSVSIISVMVDGTNDRIGALSGKLGRIEGVNAKSVLSNKKYEGE